MKMRNSKTLFDEHVRAGCEHESRAQLKLAAHEFRQALRIRPRSAVVRKKLHNVEISLAEQLHSPVSVSADRFASLFNLGVRYWDRNMPSSAYKEVCLLCMYISYLVRKSS